jgi:hypothetical protein
MAGEVLTHALAFSKAEVTKAMSWVTLLKSLRSPTNAVIFRLAAAPKLSPATPQTPPARLIEVTGHSGSLSNEQFEIEETGLTVGTGVFHEQLRNFFRAHGMWMSPAEWVDELLRFLPQIMYTGGDAGIPAALLDTHIGVFYKLPSGQRADITVRQFIAEIESRWASIQADFIAAKAGLPA